MKQKRPARWRRCRYGWDTAFHRPTGLWAQIYEDKDRPAIWRVYRDPNSAIVAEGPVITTKEAKKHALAVLWALIEVTQ